MPQSKSSTTLSTTVGAVQNGSTPSSAAGSTTSSTATPNTAGSTATSSAPTGTVLASLGVTNKGFTQVQVKSIATSAFQTKLTKRLNGLENDLPADSSLTFNQQTFTVAAIVSVLKAVLALFTAKASATSQAKTMVSAAVAALNAELPVANQFLTGLDGALMTLFGKGNPVLANFGLTKGTRKTPTVTTKAQAKGTAKLTRTARNTMGKVAKAKVKGGTATLAVTGPSGQVLDASSGTAAPAAATNGSNGNTAGK